MIKIVSYGMQGTAVTATIAYTRGDGSEASFDVGIEGSQLLNYSVEQVKQWVLARVAQRRNQDLVDAVGAFLQPLMGVDLEV